MAILLAAAPELKAQATTGKVEGVVRGQSGEPLAGAQVLIVGSAFRSTTNERGYYFINGVPAGVVVVRAQYIGHAPSEIRDLRIFADQTVTADHVLVPRAIEVAEITVTAAANLLVPRDQVTTKPVVRGELIQALPLDNVQQALALQPGVVETGRGLSLRGSRVGEAAIYLDGVPIRSVSGNTGTGSLLQGEVLSVNLVGTNALEEASVTTGVIGATQGDAMSGVISFVTRSGGSRLRGNFSLATDEVAGQIRGQGLNRLEASLGGPIARHLTFFVATSMQGQQSPRRGKGAEDEPIYVLNGIDTTLVLAVAPGIPLSDSAAVVLPAFTRYSRGQRRPDNWSSAWNSDAKLQYSYGEGSRLSATFHRTRNQGLFYRERNVFNPMAQTGTRSSSSVAAVNWSQNLARSGARQLRLDAIVSVQSDQTLAGQVDPAWFQNHRAPFGQFALGAIPFVYDLDNFPLDDRLMQNIRVGNCALGRDAARPSLGGCSPAYGRNDLDLSAPIRANPWGVSASYLPSSGIGDPQINLASERRVTAHVSIDWQLDRYNRVQAGGDYVRADSRNFASGLTSRFGMDAAYYQPHRFGFFATDRIDLGDLVIDLGLRYDGMKSGVLYPNVPGRLFSDPLREGTSGLTSASPAGDTVTALRCQSALSGADTLTWSTCNMYEGRARHVLAPSIRVSFPVTDHTGFRIAFGQQAQTPDFNLLARRANVDGNLGGGFRGTDLDYAKTVLFEFGVRHAFSQNMVLDIAAYNKDQVSEIAARSVPYSDPFRRDTAYITLYTNADFGNVRGVDIKLDRRVGRLFQGSLGYTLESARSTGSDPFEFVSVQAAQAQNVTDDRLSPPEAIRLTRDNRTHTIAGSLALTFPRGWHAGTLIGSILQDGGAFATFRFASGLAYTRIDNQGSGIRGPGNAAAGTTTGTEEINGWAMPWVRNVDLRLTRGFRAGGTRDITVFADFRNLFNWTNLVAIFAETGGPANNVFERSTIDPIKVTLRNEAGALLKIRTVTLADGSTANETGVDLGDCSKYQPTFWAGLPNCILLRRAEARFGDGDQFFTDAEQNVAYGAWYRLNQGPYTLKGPGLNFRLGFEFNF